MACIRNYDQLTVYIHDFPRTNNKLPTIPITYVPVANDKKYDQEENVNLDRIRLVALHKKTIIISTKIHQSQYLT